MKNGKPVVKPLTSPDHISDEAVRLNQMQSLSIASRCLIEVPIELRDFASLIMAIDPDKLVDARPLIRRFRDQLSSLLEAGKRREVYRLNIQLFPLSKVNV